jgi:uncharacterized protein (DUF58 family)
MAAATPPERVLRRLDWQLVRRLDGLLQGDHPSFFRGAGLDLAGLREYQPGDDVRALDWNVTARTGVPHIRLFEEEREITAWFLLDLSPSIDFGTGPDGRDKRAVLLELTGVLARLLTRSGDRVGGIVYSSAIERVVPARGGRVGALSLIAALLEEPRRARAPETSLAVLLDEADRVIRRRSMIVLLSDFLTRPGWEVSLGRLRRRHDVLAIRLVDPRELTLPNVGPVVLQDAETGERLLVDTGDRGLRARFAQAATERTATIERSLRRAGVDAATIATDEDLVAALVSVARRRRRPRRVA